MAPISADRAPKPPTVYPTGLRLASALALVKSKPPSLSIKDFILQLRKHTRPGRRGEFAGHNHQCTDTTAFWKDAYEKGEAAQAELRNRIFELERQNEILRSTSKLPLPPIDQGPSFGKRRRGDAEESTTSATRPRKQAKATHDSLPDTGITCPSIFGDSIAVDSISSSGGSLMLQYSTLHYLLKQKKPGAAVLTSVLVHFCYAAAIDITSLFTSHGDPTEASVATSSSRTMQISLYPKETVKVCNFEFMLRSIARSLILFISGFDKLVRLQGGKKDRGCVVYGYVKLFSDLLECILSVSRSRVRDQIEGKGPSKARSRADHVKKGEPPSLDKDFNVRLHVANLLVSMIHILNPDDPNHSELLEGLFFVLLESIGKSLYARVLELEGFFERRPCTTTGAEDGQSGLQAYPRMEKFPRSDLERRAAGEQSYYLIWIMGRVMAYAPTQQRTPNRTAASETPMRKWDTGRRMSNDVQSYDKTKLSEKARERLQNTLLRAVFGPNNSEFADALKMPAAFESPSNEALPRLEDVKDPRWLQHEVWRLLGWEVLGRTPT